MTALGLSLIRWRHIAIFGVTGVKSAATTPDDGAVAASHAVDPASWRELFDELMSLVAGRFGRVEPRRTAREFVLGLLSPAERSV